MNLFNLRDKNHDEALAVCRHEAVLFVKDRNSLDPDVTFIVDDKKFPAHKRILKVSCEWFYDKYVEPFDSSSEIEIKNVKLSGFEQFLRFCHFGELNLNTTNMIPTYEVASTYQHATLLVFCCDFICDNVQVSNVLEILDWNVKHQNYRIMRCCREFFMINAGEILRTTDQFRKISKKFLKTILSLEALNCSEKLLFDQTLKWAEENCKKGQIEPTTENKLKMLVDVLSLIRLDISDNLEALNDFPRNPRDNLFSKLKFEKITAMKDLEKTCEEIPATNENTTYYGFSIILSNPESTPDAFEEFVMTIECEGELVFERSMKIKIHDYLAIKDYMFEEPVVTMMLKKHSLKIKFEDPNRLRFMDKYESEGETCARILRLFS